MDGIELLGGLDVVENDSRCDGGGWMALQAEALEGADAELALDQRDGVVAGEDPVVDSGFGGGAVAGSIEFMGNLG